MSLGQATGTTAALTQVEDRGQGLHRTFGWGVGVTNQPNHQAELKSAVHCYGLDWGLNVDQDTDLGSRRDVLASRAGGDSLGRAGRGGVGADLEVRRSASRESERDRETERARERESERARE